MDRTLFAPEHQVFRSAFRQFLEAEAIPFTQAWEDSGTPDRQFIVRAGEAGFLGFEFPIEFGGLDIADFRYNAVMIEEVVSSGISGDTFTMQNDIVVPYYLGLMTPAQKARWFPLFTRGRALTALAMTEPGAGSDLKSIVTTARQHGADLILNGSKTFITSGATCDLAIVLARTGEPNGKEMSLILVEAGTPGFDRGRPMKKIGHKGQDTAELFFSDCRVPLENLLGSWGGGLTHVMSNLPRERLAIGLSGIASARRALGLALDHVRNRRAFHGTLGDLQSVRLSIADMHTDIAVLQTYLDRCVQSLCAGALSAEEAAAAKYKGTELQWDVADGVLQLFGGYGYSEEYPIARLWRDARVQRIYGGANEVMRDVIGRAVIAQ